MSKTGTIESRQGLVDHEALVARAERELADLLRDYCAPIRRSAILTLIRSLQECHEEIAAFVESEAQSGQCIGRNDAHVGMHVLAEVEGKWVECVIRDIGKYADREKCMLRFAHVEETKGLRIGWRKYSDLRPVRSQEEVERESHQ